MPFGESSYLLTQPAQILMEFAFGSDFLTTRLIGNLIHVMTLISGVKSILDFHRRQFQK